MSQPQQPRSGIVEPGKGIVRHIRPVWLGIAFMALITYFATVLASSFHLFVFNSILLAAMGAIALQVLQGTAGLFSVGNAAFLLVGAFSSVFVLRAGLPFPMDIIVATLVAGIGGLIVGLPALRLRGLYLVLSTLAAHFIATFLGNFYQGQVPSARAAGFFLPILFGSYSDDGGKYWAWLLFVIVSFLILGATRILRERSGRALRMIREHELIAPTLGIPVSRYKLQIFILSSMVVGFEGSLLAHLNGSVQVEAFPLTLAFQYVLMVVIGGLDSIAGAVMGAAAVVALPILVPNIVTWIKPTGLDPTFGANTSLIIYGIIVIFFVTASPDGIVGLLRKFRRTLLRVSSSAGSSLRS